MCWFSMKYFRLSHGGRSLVGYSPWGSQRVGHDWATSLHFIGYPFLLPSLVVSLEESPTVEFPGSHLIDNSIYPGAEGPIVLSYAQNLPCADVKAQVKNWEGLVMRSACQTPWRRLWGLLFYIFFKRIPSSFETQLQRNIPSHTSFW